jgi:hypothetical protein
MKAPLEEQGGDARIGDQSNLRSRREGTILPTAWTKKAATPLIGTNQEMSKGRIGLADRAAF